MIFKMYHACITVLDLEKSLAFYREALGLESVKEINAADGSYKIVFLGHPGQQAQLEITWYRDRKEAYNLGDNETHIGFRTDDYEAAWKRHSDMGCICYENKSMGLYFIADPDGYWMEIVPNR